MATRRLTEDEFLRYAGETVEGQVRGGVARKDVAKALGISLSNLRQTLVGERTIGPKFLQAFGYRKEPARYVREDA